MITTHRSKLGTAALCFALLQFQLTGLLSQNCNYNWSFQNSGTTSILNTVKAVNENICWTAGNSAMVRRTTDGGITWLNANPNPGIINGNILNVEAIDGNTAWVTTSPAISTFIYKTTNGGSNWAQVYSQTGGFINGISMISASNGFAFGDPISNKWMILATTNGGLNWLPHPLSPTAQVSEVGFENCFQVSLPYMWFGASLGSVYRTTNNGVNWTSHPTPGINTYVFALHFNSLTLGLASALSMVRSTDAGNTYNALPVPGLGNINGIEGAGTELWYVRGSSIYRSGDSGNNWAIAHQTGITMLHIDFPNSITGCQMGWAVGYAGTIVKMTSSPLAVNSGKSGIPLSYNLEQNYPNPFNPVTNIRIALPEAGIVRLVVRDILGSEISVLADSYLEAGFHNYSFDASHLSSGIYFFTLKASDFEMTKKMALVK